MNAIGKLCEDIAHRDALDRSIRKRLETHGPILVDEARGEYSLRDLARRTGFSAAYLSLVATRRQRISAGAFARLAREAELTR
jgi:transcriptional regulator with XRE-family HTH domain